MNIYWKFYFVGYVEMKPGVTPPNLSNSGPYLEMKPGTSPSRASEYAFMDLNRAYVNRTDLPRNDYMDMNAKNNSKKPLTNNNYAYVNYPDHNNDLNHHQPTIRRSYSQLSPSTVNGFRGSPNSDYLDMNSKGRIRSDSDQSNEGYVEMSLGRGHHRQSSLDSAQLNREEYSGMSAGSVLKKKELKSNKKENNRSLPIQILNSNQTINGRIYSEGSSPKMQLNLTNTTSPVASLPRGRKNSIRRDSRDSSSSNTPSNSSTIFPLSLNSPSSPVKPLKTPEKSTPSLILNSLYKRFRGKSNGSDSQDDSAASDVQKNSVSNNKNHTKSSDYMNLDLSENGVNNNHGDYAEMQPGAHSVPNMNKAFNLMSLSETSSRVFRPISESRESGISPPSSTLPINSPTSSSNESPKTEDSEVKSDTRCTGSSSESSVSRSVSRPGSASSDLCSSSSTLVGSRPDSVNSDSIRPPSALHYANLDLQSIDDDGSRSPRTTRNNSNENGQEVSFTYAEIDFNKSEGLKKSVQH